MTTAERPRRLSVLFDDKPAYLYSFTQSSYEDRVRFVCVHPLAMTPAEVRERIAAVLPLLPEEIEYDFMAPEHPPDLFEQAVVLAGFTVVEDQLLLGMRAPRLSALVTRRDSIERALSDG